MQIALALAIIMCSIILITSDDSMIQQSISQSVSIPITNEHYLHTFRRHYITGQQVVIVYPSSSGCPHETKDSLRRSDWLRENKVPPLTIMHAYTLRILIDFTETL